jgi:hypothetical protein
MLFSPGKKMAILMLLTILVLSLLLGSLREGMEDAAVQVVNKDAPSVSDPSVSSVSSVSSNPKKSTPDGIQLPNQEKPVTVDQITKILGSNQAVQQLLKK